MYDKDRTWTGNEIAVIGMAGRFPQARTLDELWQHLAEGHELISTFSPEELAAAGIPPAVLSDPRYVPRRGVLEGADLFDAAFFDYSPREAEILDPQQRVLLECAWEALEHAGYNARTYPGLIGVYAGVGTSNYYFHLLHHLMMDAGLRATIDPFQLALSNEKDYLATRVAYKLNLRGPALTVQTACSTSLVAVHLACQSLLNGECDLALVGGSSIHSGNQGGYLYMEGGIYSPDGHCRAFDAQAQGTVSGEGVGVVILKRLAEALREGDTIHAIIKGSACNNDGATKVGYTAPSIQGQAAVIAEALAMAGVAPESVGYIEAHGTATPLGDPIEIAALTQAFRRQTEKKHFCAVGSIKTNMGHLSAAAGIAGFIKTVLALKQRMLPPSLHYQAPNPQIDLRESPFYINNQLRPWEYGRDGEPRRAGVSSFGIGGTNVHVVLEEAPAWPVASRAFPDWLVVPLSAKSGTALEQANAQLATYLRTHSELEGADVAYTLQIGRGIFPYRQVIIARSCSDIARVSEQADPARLLRSVTYASERPVVLLFPGQGTQYIVMGRELYQHADVFRQELDHCAELLLPMLKLDIRSVLYPELISQTGAEQDITQTWLTQPVLFVIEYALARLWESWGITSAAMLGHSIGEYVAACLAGVFSLEAALSLVVARGRLLFDCAPGSMLAVSLSPGELQEQLTDFSPTWEQSLSIAAINAPNQCTVSGETDQITAFCQYTQQQQIQSRILQTSHAFHSHMVEPMLGAFERVLQATELRPPQRRFISNLTGDWITTAQATDPSYWVRHLRQCVQFSQGIATLLREQEWVFLEAGPGRSLSNLVRQQLPATAWNLVISSLKHATEDQSDLLVLMTSLGRLWLAGVQIDWPQVHAQAPKRRVPLPTYPFEHQRYWVDFPAPAGIREQNIVHRSTEEQMQTVQASQDIRTPLTNQANAPIPHKRLGNYPRPQLPTPYVAPANETEQVLAGVWEDLLGIDQIGRHDAFFELGGQSLLATQMIAHIEEKLHYHVPLKMLFTYPTVAALATAIKEQQSQEPPSPVSLASLAPIPRSVDQGTRQSYPLSFAQQRLWFVEQLAPDTRAYIMTTTIQWREQLHLQALQWSLDAIVRRHASLRTNFFSQDNQPVQVIHPMVPVDLLVIDLRDCVQQHQCIRGIIEEYSRRPFDLAQGTLFRTVLFSLAAEEHLLLIVLHHIIADAWSLGIFMRELITGYEAYRHDREPLFPELPLQYADFAIWQRNRLQGELLEQHVRYWQKQLRGARALLLPTDYPRQVVQSYQGASLPFLLATPLIEALAALSHEQDTTLFMTLLAAFQVVLYRLSGQSDLVVGTDVANRERVETEPLIGFFVNLLALRTTVNGALSFLELLTQVRTTVLEALSHQELPFDLLTEQLRLERVGNQTPLIHVLFVLQNTPGLHSHYGKAGSGAWQRASTTAKFDLALFLQPQGEQFSGVVNYRTDLFQVATIAQVIEHFQVLLQQIVAHPTTVINAFALPSLQKKEQDVVQREKQHRLSLLKLQHGK